VSVLLGNGDGTVDARTDHATPEVATSVAVGDLNDDDRLDVATTNEATPSVSVLLTTTGLTAPGAPTIDGAVAGYGRATVSWTVPASDGGSPVTGYLVTPYIGFFPLESLSFDATATTRSITGLTVGTTYRFRVRAFNDAGVGDFSKITNPVIPMAPTVQSAPTIVGAVAGNSQATVSWTAPTFDGGADLLGYMVTPYIGFGARPPQFFPSSATTQTITDVWNGITYRFRVQAVNAVGLSAYSKVTNPVTPTAA